MGDEILKTAIALILSLILSSTLEAANNDKFKDKIAQYDKLFSQISEKRIGVSNSKINTVKNPFIMTYSKVVVEDGNGTV